MGWNHLQQRYLRKENTFTQIGADERTHSSVGLLLDAVTCNVRTQATSIKCKIKITNGNVCGYNGKYQFVGIVWTGRNTTSLMCKQFHIITQKLGYIAKSAINRTSSL